MLALSGVLLAGLLVAISAPDVRAQEPGPVTMAIDATTGALIAGPASGSTTALPSLLPDGVDAESFAVSDDGSVIAVLTRSGTDRKEGFPRAALGLWVTTPSGTRNLAANVDSSIAVTADGSAVVWTSTTSTGVRLFRFDPATGSSTLACSSCLPSSLAGRPAWAYNLEAVTLGSTLRVGVTMVATGAAGQLAASRVRVLDLTSGAPAVRYDSVTTFANPATRYEGADLAFSPDGNTLVDLKARKAPYDSLYDDRNSEIGTVDLSAATPVWTGRDRWGYYNPRHLDGTWYLFSDTGIYSTTSVSTTTDFVTITPGAPRVDGATTYGYRPVRATPAPITAPAPHVITARYLKPSTTHMLPGHTVGFDPVALYQPAAGAAGLAPGAVGPILGSYYMGGRLQISYLGRPWRTVETQRTFANDRWFVAGFIARQTLRYRWVFDGSANLPAITSPTVAVVVHATVAVNARAKAGRIILWGQVSRDFGTLLLQRRIGTRWTTQVTKRITAMRGGGAGVFTFGPRAFPHGQYRVATVGDGHQAQGLSRVMRF